MLAQSEVVPYLLQHHLISAGSVVDGDIAVLDASRRNRNFKVISEQGRCYFVKQAAEAD
jgi:hypothetical protein